MKASGKWLENWPAGLLTSGVSMVLGFGCLIFTESLSDLSYDLPFVLRQEIKTDEVVIVYMDDESHAILQEQPSFDRWDRSLHAHLIERLQAYAAKVVVFDVAFDTTSNPQADQKLVSAAKAYGKVAVSAFTGAKEFNHQPVTAKTYPPFDALRDVVAAWGVPEGSYQEDAMRQHFVGATSAPSLSWKVAELTMTHPPDPATPRWLNYYGPPGSIPSVSFHQVLSNSVSLMVLSNKVVFVGALATVGFTGGRGTDDYRTPYTVWYREHKRSPGVEVNATAYLNLLRGDWLQRTSPSVECLLILVLGGLSGYGLTRLRPLPATGAGIGLMLLGGMVACELVWQERIWFPWLIFSGVQVPVALFCAALLSTEKVFAATNRSERAFANATPVASPVINPSAADAEAYQNLQALMRAQLYPPEKAVILPNAVLDGGPGPLRVPDHELLRNVGKGSYGEVWLARSVMGSYRAVKVIYRRSFSEARPYDREFEGLRRFEPISRSHPGLVQILHVGRDDEAGYFYYSMEVADDLVPGQEISPASYTPMTLRKVISKRDRLPLDECLQTARFLTEALVYLHGQGLIHRDIKPTNIIFVKGRPKFADIGLVTEIGENRSWMGTEGYVPPEGPGAPSGDLYSLGKVLYEMSTGMPCKRFPELPTMVNKSDSPKALAKFNDMVLKACHSNPKKRYASAEEMLHDIERLQKGGIGWFTKLKSSVIRK